MIMTTKNENEEEDEDDLQLLFPLISLFQLSVMEGRTDEQTDRRRNGGTDGGTDTVAYRDAETHLKTVCNLVRCMN